MNAEQDGSSRWQVYIIRAADGTLYTGITTDIERRWREHSEQRGGAKYFRGRRPERVVYLEPGHSRSSASSREAAIKRLSRPAKERLLAAPTNTLREGATVEPC